MAKRKNQQPRISKIDPKAISLRAMDMGVVTWLFDESIFDDFAKLQKNILHAISKPDAKTGHSKLLKLAGEGKLLGIQHEYEIIDGDGVPGVDFLVVKSQRKRPPATGHWYDPVNTQLDLPSGRLRVLYDETAFERKSLEESYLIEMNPGFYKLSVFTRVYEAEYPGAARAAAPDLAVYLTNSRRPSKPAMPTKPLVPIHPPEQDIKALFRKVRGLPPLQESKTESQHLADGVYQAEVWRAEPQGVLAMSMTEKDLEKFGYEPGRLVELRFGKGNSEQSLHVVLAPQRGFDPAAWPGLDKDKRKVDNLSWTLVADDKMYFLPIKESRKKPLKIEPGLQTVGRLIPVDQPAVNTKPSAANSKDATSVSKTPGTSGKAFDKLVQQLEVADSWTMACLVEKNGISFIGAVNVFPAKILTDPRGRKVKMAAEISATWAQVQGSRVGQETEKNFRGYPAGIQRAFKWVHTQARGGMIWLNRFELKLEVPRGQKVDRRAARSAAKQAWHDMFVGNE